MRTDRDGLHAARKRVRAGSAIARLPFAKKQLPQTPPSTPPSVAAMGVAVPTPPRTFIAARATLVQVHLSNVTRDFR